MTTKHKHYDLIVAWAGGAKIQVLIGSVDWRDTTTPSWHPDLVYRVKPKPLVKKWLWVIKTTHGYTVTSSRYSEETAKSEPLFIQKIEGSMIEVDE